MTCETTLPTTTPCETTLPTTTPCETTTTSCETTTPCSTTIQSTETTCAIETTTTCSIQTTCATMSTACFSFTSTAPSITTSEEVQSHDEHSQSHSKVPVESVDNTTTKSSESTNSSTETTSSQHSKINSTGGRYNSPKGVTPEGSSAGYSHSGTSQNSSKYEAAEEGSSKHHTKPVQVTNKIENNKQAYNEDASDEDDDEEPYGHSGSKIDSVNKHVRKQNHGRKGHFHKMLAPVALKFVDSAENKNLQTTSPISSPAGKSTILTRIFDVDGNNGEAYSRSNRVPVVLTSNETHHIFLMPNGTGLNYIANPFIKFIINHY